MRVGRRSSFVALALLAGCGRLGFAPEGGDDIGTGDGGGGDGASPACVAHETRVTTTALKPRTQTYLAWSGTSFAVIWVDTTALRFAHLDATGAVAAPSTTIIAGGNSVDLVGAGSTWTVSYGLSSGNSTEIWVTQRDDAGAVIGTDDLIISINQSANAPALSVAPSGFGIAWDDSRQGPDAKQRFVRLDSAGAPIGTDVQVASQTGWSGGGSIASSAAEYGVVYDQVDTSTQVYFQRIDSGGALVGSPVPLGAPFGGGAGRTSVVWNGSEYGVAWSDPLENLWFTRVDVSGVPIGSPRSLGVGNTTTLAWSGAEWGVAWLHNTGFFLTRLAQDGTPRPPTQAISTTAIRHSDLVWAGDRYALSWIDGRNNTDDVYVALLCPE